MMSDFCEIVVKGHLDVDWSEWFEGLTIAHNDKGETMLSGHIRDQAALYGIIAKVRDMGLSLILVKFMAGESTQESSKGISASEDDS
jgi:hypothetical protein